MIKNQNITLNHVLAQGLGNVVSDMNGEKVILSIDRGKYYNLGEVGGVIWDTLESRISVSDLINHLLLEYDVDKKKCEEEVISFVEHLYKEGLIQIEER
ncbi:lasso peptide biosynthesis PqqD family chaperone [Bacillus sp. JJ634]